MAASFDGTVLYKSTVDCPEIYVYEIQSSALNPHDSISSRAVVNFEKLSNKYPSFDLFRICSLIISGKSHWILSCHRVNSHSSKLYCSTQGEFPPPTKGPCPSLFPVPTRKNFCSQMPPEKSSRLSITPTSG